MLSPAVCGFPSPAEQYVDAPLDLNELLVKNPPATYFVRAAGNSMVDAGIQEGDILVVDRSIQPENNAIVIACVDNEFTVKYLRMDGETVSLVPANRRYKPITFNTELPWSKGRISVITAGSFQHKRWCFWCERY